MQVPGAQPVSSHLTPRFLSMAYSVPSMDCLVLLVRFITDTAEMAARLPL